MHGFMESFESRHSNQDFTAQLGKELGVTAPLSDWTAKQNMVRHSGRPGRHCISLFI